MGGARSHGNTAKTDETRPPAACLAVPTGFLSVLAVFERASGVESRAGTTVVGPIADWRARRAERLAAEGQAHGDDTGGSCAMPGRPLPHPEQRCAACSWCVPVDPEREPEYWASHWRRFTEWR